MVYHLTYSIVIRLYQHILKIIEEQYKINVIYKETNVTKSVIYVSMFYLFLSERMFEMFFDFLCFHL
jgi:hypothetical protein